MATSAASTRTIVTKFVLENFKSYAGIREIGPMHKRFLAVVGPNGSGKSNLIDALLFIFGKRAKKLRMKNLSSLIHNSTEHPDAKEARVEIHFCEIDDADPVTASDETDAYNPIPGSDFVLARTVRIDNTSFYTLNGKRMTFEEIEVFMKTKGIDINNNRFLILQGEVEAISMMKPKGETKHEEGMLEFLEELIGTDKYVEDIEKGQALVEALSQNRAIKLEQVKVGEKEMAALEGPKDEAVRFQFLEVSIAENRCKIFASRLKQCVAKCVDSEAAKAATSETFSGQRKELSELQEQVTLLDNEFKSKKEGHAMIVKSMDEVKEAFAKFERRTIKDEAKSRQLVAKVEKSEAALDQARKAKVSEEEKIYELESDLPSLQLHLEKAEKALAQAEEDLERLRVESREEARQVREKVEKKQAELVPVAQEASTIESEVNVLEKEVNLLEQPMKEAKSMLAGLQKQQKESTELCNTLPAEIESTMATLKEASDELKVCEETITSLKQKETDLEQECQSLSAMLKTAAASSSSKTKGSVFSKLREATKKGGDLDGCSLFGRLGDLGTVADEYDTAATTAAGSSLDSFVCKTTEDAEKCVQYLRKENLGVSTFIILDKIGKVPETKSTFPSSRVFDLITPSTPEVAPAFYYALKDTLVCKDLEEAVAVAYVGDHCKWRVVTLRGELIDKSGTMSGGGKPRKGGFASSSSTQSSSSDDFSEKELSEFKTKLDSLQKSLEESRSQLDKETKLRPMFQRARTELEDKLEAMKRDLESAQQKLTLSQTKLVEIKSRVELTTEDVAQLKQLQANLEKLIPKRDATRKACQKIEAELAELNQGLQELGGEKGKQLRLKVEQCRDKLEKARASVTKCQVGIDAAKLSPQKAETAVEKIGAELEIALAEQENHEKERVKTQEKADETMEKFKRATEEEASARAVMERIKRDLNDAKAKYNALESGSMEMKIKLEQAEEECKKAYGRRSKWEQELKQAKSRLEEWRKSTAEFEAEEEVKVSEDEVMKVSEGDEEQMKENEPVKETKASPQEEELEEEIVQLSDNDLTRLENEVSRLETEAKALRGNVNMGAIAEYKSREKEYLEKVKELEEASGARDQARAQCDELRKKRLVEFMAGFSVISLKLKEIYQLITLGGDAELELVDSLDPFSEGVVFSVRPPKKSWKNISNLSGGEKTLSSLSLVFALHAFRGAPIYVMDEIDAALDFKNVSIVANYIKERTKNAQFLIISLRNNMFELADRLVGVYKTNNATKSVTINPNRVAAKSGIAHQLEDGENKPKEKQARTSSVLGERDPNAMVQ